MKIIRFAGWLRHSGGPRSYGYIRANWLERTAIRALIAAGRTSIREAPRAPGPKAYHATFIITAKRGPAC